MPEGERLEDTEDLGLKGYAERLGFSGSFGSEDLGETDIQNPDADAGVFAIESKDHVFCSYLEDFCDFFKD